MTGCSVPLGGVNRGRERERGRLAGTRMYPMRLGQGALDVSLRCISHGGRTFFTFLSALNERMPERTGMCARFSLTEDGRTPS